jgi:hypothetical protein
MPGRNGMGPIGQGPRTGRGRGFCRGSAFVGGGPPQEQSLGMGCGGGGGRGWRHRHMFYATGLPGWQRKGMAEPQGRGPR